MSGILCVTLPPISEMSKTPQSNPPKPSSNKEEPRAVTRTGITAEFSGPIPPPSLLKGYEDIVPGAAERILSMAEADASHQREIEFAALNAEVYGLRRGQVSGVIVVLAALVVAAFCAYLGHEVAASTIGG